MGIKNRLRLYKVLFYTNFVFFFLNASMTSALFQMQKDKEALLTFLVAIFNAVVIYKNAIEIKKLEESIK